MRILQAGYQVTQQQAEDEQKGVEPQHRSNLDDFDSRMQSGDFDDQIKEAEKKGVDPATL